MTEPINVNVDLAVRAAYVEYADESSVETIELNEAGSVAYDLDADGNVVGIEVLGIERPEQIEIARAFARTHDLAFPRDLSGNLVPA